MKTKKFLHLMLAFTFMISLLPANIAHAEEFSGKGTQNDPYLIENLAQIKTFRDIVNKGTYYENNYFRLTNDIDLSGSSSNSWVPIKEFRGTFDGGNHEIKNLYISSSSNRQGLFGTVASRGTIKNLTVSGTINIPKEATCFAIGGIAGENAGTIENCINKVNIKSNSTSKTDGVGGIAGWVASSKIKKCYNAGTISGTIINSGGITGYCGTNDATVENCYNTGNISTSYTKDYAGIGGIIGKATHVNVKNCYSIGTVTASGKKYVGGAVGINSSSQNITSVYYLKGCNGTNTVFDSTYGTEITSEQLKTESTFIDWDFDNIWYMDKNAGRPLLKVEPNLPYSTTKYDLDGDGVKDYVYELSTADHLCTFASTVNNYNKKLKAVLTRDIDLSGRTWTPIGVNYSDFEGIFDGQGHTISNMKFTTVQNGYGGNLTYDYQGLFGVIRNKAIVRNFTVNGEITLSENNQKYIGGAVGLAYEDALISNVTSYVNITDGNTAYSGITDIGGVVGKIGNSQKKDSKIIETSGYVDWCKYYGKINVDTASKVGGIVGCAIINSSITNSTNYGTVGWNYIGHIGGIAGSTGNEILVKNCANYGSVSARRNDCVGGVVGYIQNGTIENCLNGGSVTGIKSNLSNEPDVYLGGILGYQNNSNLKGVTNCFNYGKITDLGGNYTNTGAIIGYSKDTTGGAKIKDNYYLNSSLAGSTQKASGRGSVGINTSVSSEKAASGEIAYKLQGSQAEQVWGQSLSGENLESYPSIGGAKVYRITECNGNFLYANKEIEKSHNYENDVCTNCGASKELTTNADGYLQIASKSDFIHFKNLVNTNGAKDTINAVLTADIDLSGYDYMPIGTEGNEFIGTFDGDGHKIENLTITADSSYMGMFGRTNGADVKNFTVSGNITSVSNGLEVIGGVIAHANNTTISDVISKINFKDNKEIEHIYRAGGIAAVATNGTTFTNCEYSGNVNMHFGSTMAGIAGDVYGSTKENPIVIKNCVNKADMTFDISRRVAGIIGWSDTYTTVSQCSNYGNITVTESDRINQTAGIVAATINALTIEDCANYGNISDGKYNSSLGGIVSYIEVQKNAADFGGVKNCFNYGMITNTHENGSTYWGSVIGFIKNDDTNQTITDKITNNYYLSGTAPTVSGTDGISLSATEVSADTVSSGEIAHKLQGTREEKVWGQSLTGNNSTPYPVLGGNSVHKVTFMASGEIYATKYANETGIGTLPENPGDDFAKWLCGNTADSTEFTAETPINSDMTVYAFKTDIQTPEDSSDKIEILFGKSVEIDLRDYVKSTYGNNFTFSINRGTLPQGLTLGDDGYTIAGTSNTIGSYTVTFNVQNNNILNDEGTLLTLTFNVEQFIGEGTEKNPYLISSADELKILRDNVNNGNSYEGKYIKLTADFSLEGSDANQWEPIGNSTNQFKGTFDGDDHKITGLYINNSLLYQGLFGYVGNGGTVANLEVDGTVTARAYAAGIASYNYGSVINCHNMVFVSGKIGVGGVVALNTTDGLIKNCYNTGNVTSTDATNPVGGVLCSNQGTIENSYNIGKVSGITYVGGVLGYNHPNATIKNCYNIGYVSGLNDVGGALGFNYGTIKNCYNIGTVNGSGSNIGGVLGYNSPDCSVENCFYLNTCAAAKTTFDSTLGIALTAEQMKNSKYFEEWDFTSTWVMGNISPMLRSNSEVHSINNPDVIISTVNEFKTFRDYVNNGNSYEGMYILLKNDLDLEGSDANQWEPIGNSTTQFKGTFDGDNHTISGLYVVSQSDFEDHLGLFELLPENGVIKNLSVNGNLTSSYSEHSGILAGTNCGNIINCRISGTVKSDSSITGGITGYNSGNITDCRFSGTVDSPNVDAVGGITGDNRGNITRCSTSGTVNGFSSIGGIAGDNDGNITDCYNISDVYSQHRFIGGIVGDNHGSVENCYNAGTITGLSDIGGIAGNNNDNSYVKGCYNSGKIKGNTKIGAILGCIYTQNEITSDMIPSDCYYLNTCIAENNEYGTALTAAQMKNPTSFIGWDFNEKWTIGYLSPYLKALKEEHSANVPDKVITSLDDLKKFRDNVNNGDTYSGKYILLANDLDLGGSENPWTPIGKCQWDDAGFKGTFDGGNHTISGIYINNSESESQGLFGGLKADGTIKNLNVFGDVSGKYCIGLLAGYSEGIITYCNASGKVSGYDGIGILVGVNYGDIKNCTSSGETPNYSNRVGGIAGSNYSTITNCYNTGNISGEYEVGGIAGYNYNDAHYVKDTAITNCYNTGNISGKSYVGGIAGIIEATNVDNCYNIGNITGEYEIGGIIGYISGPDENAYIHPYNCYYLDTCITDGNEHGDALTADEMKNSKKYNAWDFNITWTMGIDRPLLNLNTEIQCFKVKTVAAAETKATADIFIPAAGTYTVIFADYENGILNTLDPVTITVAEDSLGTQTVTSNLDITLGKDDKVMLWNSLSEMTPLCESYKIK